MAARPRTIDEYLAPLSDEKRATLEKLRTAIRSAAPTAQECISYQIPAYRLGGRLLVAWRGHESLRLLRRCVPDPSPQGRARGLRHQQGHDPLSSEKPLTRHTGAEAGQNANCGARRQTPGWSAKRYTPPLNRSAASRCSSVYRGNVMCRNIRILFNFEPPVTEDEIRSAALQFVRKVSGFNKPSQANEAAFGAAVDEIAAVSSKLLRSLETNAPPRNRAEEAAKAHARATLRFSRPEHS